MGASDANSSSSIVPCSVSMRAMNAPDASASRARARYQPSVRATPLLSRQERKREMLAARMRSRGSPGRSIPASARVRLSGNGPVFLANTESTRVQKARRASRSRSARLAVYDAIALLRSSIVAPFVSALNAVARTSKSESASSVRSLVRASAIVAVLSASCARAPVAAARTRTSASPSAWSSLVSARRGGARPSSSAAAARRSHLESARHGAHAAINRPFRVAASASCRRMTKLVSARHASSHARDDVSNEKCANGAAVMRTDGSASRSASAITEAPRTPYPPAPLTALTRTRALESFDSRRSVASASPPRESPASARTRPRAA